jgi:hypothetical protein
MRFRTLISETIAKAEIPTMEETSHAKTAEVGTEYSPLKIRRNGPGQVTYRNIGSANSDAASVATADRRILKKLKMRPTAKRKRLKSAMLSKGPVIRPPLSSVPSNRETYRQTRIEQTKQAPACEI